MVVAGLAAAGPFASADSGDAATLSGDVATFVATAAPDARLDVVVTFWDGSGYDRLDALGVEGDRLQGAPMAFVSLSAAEVRDVASWSETRSVWHNEELQLYLDEGTSMVKADKVWAGEGLKRPYTGAGVGVAIVDTGIDGTHPDLTYGVKVKKNFVAGGNPVMPEPQPTAWVEAPHTDTEHGHGTHVAGTVAGTGAASGGQYTGVAPGADLYGFKAGTGASVWLWWAARAFDWVLVNGEAHNIRVVSNSWGGGGGSDYNADDPIHVLSEKLFEQGVLVVFSAGNSGGPDKLNRYATSPHVVSVAAANKDYSKASFSSTGRPGGDHSRWDTTDGVLNGIYRPTVNAPGVDIMAPRSSLGAVMSTGTDTENPFYTSASGTSMSAPHVSGVIALMLEARPQLSARNVVDVLEGTAVDQPNYERWEVGEGFVDAQAAARAAEKGKVNFPPSTKGKTPQYDLRLGATFSGFAFPAGYTLKDVDDSTVETFPVQVGEGVDALYAEISWASAFEGVYLFLYDPSGKEVASSAGLLDIGFVNHRTVVVTSPEAGNWTIRVEGRVNTGTPFDGWYGVYDQNTKTRGKTPATTTDEQPFAGEVGGGTVLISFQRTMHDVVVPEGTTDVRVAIEWTDASKDLALVLYDPSGTRVASSNAASGTSEEVVVTSGDPMGADSYLAAGTWRVEVRNWNDVAPHAYSGVAAVTHLA